MDGKDEKGAHTAAGVLRWVNDRGRKTLLDIEVDCLKRGFGLGTRIGVD